MNRSKVVAFFQEILFLGDFFKEDQVKSINFQRVDRELMVKSPEKSQAGGDPFLPLIFWSKYILLDENGKKLATVGVKPVSMKWWKPLTWSGEQQFGETVGDAIARLGDRAGEVYFVLHSSPSPPFEIILYKPPKNFTIQGWLEEEIRRERAAIRAESEEIDALAHQ